MLRAPFSFLAVKCNVLICILHFSTTNKKCRKIIRLSKKTIVRHSPRTALRWFALKMLWPKDQGLCP